MKFRSNKIIKRIKLRTWVSTGFIALLTPLVLLGLVKVINVIGAPPVASAVWKFDEGSGSTANDASNNANNGTTNSTTWLGKDFCLSENCLYFTGSSSYVSIADDADFDYAAADSFTFSVWVRYGLSANGTIILNKNGAAGGIYQVNIESDGDITCGIDDDTTYGPEDSVTSTAATYDDNKWHHIACVKNATTSLTLYIDGVSVGTPDVSFAATGTLANNGGFTLGANILSLGSGTDFLGFMDEFKMYRTALTQDEIKVDYNFGSTSRFVPAPSDFLTEGLVGWWKMDESAANGCTGGVNDSCDSSGNGLDGAWANNATTTTTSKYGRGTDYDGTDDGTAVTDNNVYSANTTNSLTVSVWMNPDVATGTRNIISKGTVSNYEWNLGANGTQAQAIVLNSGGTVIGSAFGSSTFTAGVWQHYAMTIDLNARTITLYKNGAFLASGAISGTYTNGTGNLGFGERADGANDYDGKLDDVRIYNRVLGAGEIKSIYNYAPGPTGYWRFDENSGTSVYDGGGYGSGATITDAGATTGSWENGKYGGSYNMRGNDDADVINFSTDKDMGVRNTISYWVNFYDLGGSGGANDAVIGGNSTAAGDGYMSYFDGTNIYSRQATGSGVSTAATFTNGTWYHIAVVRDGTSVTFYRDGTQLGATQTLGANNAFTLKSLTNFDNGSAAFPLEGKIDEYRVYNYARTPQQVLEDMNAGHPAGGSPIGTEAVFWHFDERDGTTANDIASGTITNGTLTNIASAATATSGWTLSGKFNAAIVFDGSNDQVTVATASDGEVDFAASEPFSACAWAYVTTMPGTSEMDAIITKWDATSTIRGYRLVVTNDDADTTGNFRAEVYDESADQTLSAVSTTDSVSTNTWNHVCLGFNGGVAGAAGDLTLYVNGNASTNSANASFLGLEDVAADFTVGDYDTTDAVAADTAFTGSLDEIEVFTSALSSDQVAIVMNANAASNFFTGQDEYATSVAGTSTSGPIDAFNFEETTGQTVSDIGSSNIQGCTLGINSSIGTDDPTVTDGKVGKALSFDGSNDWLTCGDAAALDFPDGQSFTYMAWIYRTSVTADGLIFSKKSSNNASSAGFNLYQWSSVNGGNTCIYIADGTDQLERCTNDNVTITTGQWIHVAAVFDDTSSANTTLYLNGVSARHAPYDLGTIGNINSLSNTAFFAIGAQGTASPGTPTAGSYFAGRIDQAKIFSSALSPAQINYEMNRDKPYGYWKFDDCTGSTANDSSINAQGNASNGVSGTLTIGASGTNTTTGTCTVNNSAAAWYNGRNGKFQYALDLDGTDDYVDMGNSTVMDFGTSRGGSAGTETTQDFSISMWVNRRSFTTDDTVIANAAGQAASNNGYIVWIDDATDDINFALQDGTDQFSINGTTAITATGWHHVVVVFDEDSATNSTIYVDGKVDKESTTGTITNVGLMDGASFRIGAETDAGQPYDGQIDEVQFFPYAASSAQVLKLLNQNSGARFGPLQGTP